MINFPQEWIECTLGDVLELKYGKSLPAKQRDGKGSPVYGSNGIVGFHSNPLLSHKCIIVGRKGSSGEVHFSTEPSFPIDTTYYVDEVYEQPLRYWFYLLKYLPLKYLNTSSAIPGLNRNEAYKQRIYLPSTIEQKEISSILESLLGQVDKIKTRIDGIPAILMSLRQSVLSAAVSGKLTEDWRGTEELVKWRNVLLSEVIEKPSYGTSSKSDKEGLVPVLRMGNLQNGKINWENLAFTSKKDEIEKYKLVSGDILFNRTNSPELVGKTSIYRAEREAIYAGYLIKVQCKEELNSEFLNYTLNSPKAKSYCWKVKSDGVSQSNINAKKLSAYPLDLPPEDEQVEIVKRIKLYFSLADSIESKVKEAQNRIDNLTQSILVKAFRGDLTKEWRKVNLDLITGDNSAITLLEKIKEEKKIQKPKQKNKVNTYSRLIGVVSKVNKEIKDILIENPEGITVEQLFTESKYEIDNVSDFYSELKKIGNILDEIKPTIGWPNKNKVIVKLLKE